MTDVPHRRKALPLTQSIHWVPVDTKAPAADAYLVFMHQRALNALYDHLRSSADKGVLGFLLGHLYEDPTSSQRFAVIELVMRLTVAIYGDKTTVVVSRVWDKMQEELTRSGAQLLGWYHSHPPAGIELASGDLETHATYFGEPWQWALVIATGRDGSTAGLYRPNREGADGGAVLPFYELLDPRSVTPEGKKRSSVRWLNYKPHKPPAGVTTGRSGPVPSIPETLSFKPAPAAPPPPPPPPPPPASKKPAPAPPPPPPPSTKLPPLAPVSQMPRTPTLASESVELGFVDKPPLPPPVASSGKVPALGPPPAAPSPPRKRISGKAPQFVMREPPRPASRIGFILTVVGFLIVTAAAVWYFKFGPGLGSPRRQVEAIESPPPPPAPADSVPAPSPVPAAPPSAPVATPAPAPAAAPETAPTAILRIDRISDSLTTAVQSYQERARLLRDGAGDCTMLARGLVQVEAQWAAYNAEKRTLTRQLDDARSQRDLLLFSGVDSVEAHYDRSTCRRP